MLDQSFSEKNLKKLLQPVDFVHYELKNDTKWINKELERVCDLVKKDQIKFDCFDKITKPKFDFYSCNAFETDIILRKINDNIKRLYKIKQADRFEIVKQLKSSLGDATPISLIRLDIKRFYESVNRTLIVRKILDEYLLSVESKTLIKKLFEDPIFINKSGLPRGIGLSATLSELYLRPFDKTIKNIRGVIYYARYVDDVIIVTCNNPEHVREKLNKKLDELNLELNQVKYFELTLPEKGRGLCKCEEICQCGSGFEYLGYRFSFPKSSADIEKRHVSVDISKSKISKIKTRLVTAFIEHSKRNNFPLLVRRIKYLTGNYDIPLTRTGGELKGGIYYHYPLITDETCLRSLTTFLRKLIFSKKGNLGKKIHSSLSNTERELLIRFTFEGGYKKRIIHKFSPQEIGEIKKCWKYE